MPMIYVVDDEANIRRLASLALTDNGMEVETFANGQDLFHTIRQQLPDCLIVDWMMPAPDGLEIIRRLREDTRTQNLPIIMLTAKSEEMDAVLGLELGADDYISKPFGVRELPARVRAVLRRKARTEKDAEEEILSIGDLTIDPKRRTCSKHGDSIELTTREFDLLYILMLNAGQVFSRDMLLDRVWKTNYYGDTRTVDVHIRYLRQKVEEDPSDPIYIQTVRGVGYSFAESPTKERA